jgi:secreted trypsin-like serine protease
MLRSPLVLALAVLGCAPAPPAVRRAAITNGQDDAAHPAVNLLVFDNPATGKTSACTATLIGKKTVLTAAHCMGYPNTALVVGGTRYASTKGTPHPKYDAKTSPYLNDIAVVHLDVEPPQTAAALVSGPPKAGAPVTIVGFGETSQGAKDNGVKRSAKNAIDAVEALYFTFSGATGGEGNACYGDSGGPVLVTAGAQEVVTGVMSYITGDCGPSSTMATRVDTFLSWVRGESQGDVAILDTVQPTVKIDEPADGATVASTLTLRATATDDLAVSAVELRVDGVARGTLAAAPYAFSVGLAPGGHRLEVVASDAAGNQGTAAVSVTVAGQATDGGMLDARAPGEPTRRPAEGGCGVANLSPPAPGLLPLALTLLLRRRRRR